MNLLRELMKWLLGEVTLGMLEYYRHPRAQQSWNRPFNGQERRRGIFKEILGACGVGSIVETGAYRGQTTEYMAAESNLPVFAVELNKRNYGYTKVKFGNNSAVTIELGDSRSFLSRLVKSGRLARTTLFYLDAHWGEDLPLAEELAIIFANCPGALVLIDDFRVPGDDGYAYDDYGPGKALTPEYIAPVVGMYNLAQFYPTAPSSKESGKRRGCVVLASEDDLIARLRLLTSLREWPASDATSEL